MTPIDRTTPALDPTTAAADLSAQAPTRAGAIVLTAGGVLLLTSLLINPGPGLKKVDYATYVPGHLLNGVAYLLLVLGLPAIGVVMGRRLGVLGGIGYAALVIRYTLSTGSQLFQAVIYPELASRSELRPAMVPGGRLSSIYGRWDDQVTLVLAVAMLGLVVALWRVGRPLRGPSVLLLVTAVANTVFTPVSLVAVAALSIWLGLRIARGGDIGRPLRQPRR